jgi:aryl-alcohol dehydrogenase-like predicted oxidoreductase
MKYQIFGQKSGLRVSTLALGTGNFGTAWPFGASKEDSKLVFDRYSEAGGTFIDTADGYQAGNRNPFWENLSPASGITLCWPPSTA